MRHDIAAGIYKYLAHDWGLKGDKLTAPKCEQLKREITKLRKAYWSERGIAYDKSLTRRAYLAAFAPRYAYILYRCLNRRRTKAVEILKPWHRKEGVICLMGGGPACEVFGLLDWLYEKGIEPRFLRVIIMDRQGYWRTFHNSLFAELLRKPFPKTLVVPSYEAVDFPVPKGKKFDPTSVNYGFAQIADLAEARLISVTNCLSELRDARGFECHLRFLMRIARHTQLVICADSAAPKRRKRMSWINGAFNQPGLFKVNPLLTGVIDMQFPWLRMDDTTDAIFDTTPRWENTISRWVSIQSTG
jgi:hypothetical protein